MTKQSKRHIDRHHAPAPARPTPSRSGTAVAVDWSASALAGGGVSRWPLLLPLAARQREVAEQRGEDEERDHRRRRWPPSPSSPPAIPRWKASVAIRWVELIGPPRRDRIDELEVGEGEDDREGHHDREDRQQQREGDVAEALPRRGSVEQCRLVKRGRDGLQSRPAARSRRTECRARCWRRSATSARARSMLRKSK